MLRRSNLRSAAHYIPYARAGNLLFVGGNTGGSTVGPTFLSAPSATPLPWIRSDGAALADDAPVKTEVIMQMRESRRALTIFAAIHQFVRITPP